MQEAEDFDAFVAIVDAGSISEAARELGIPRATLSRQLSRLEKRLGVRLLYRTTRRLVPTLAGDTLYPLARSLAADAVAAVARVRQLDDRPRGLLRVSAPPLHTPLLGEIVAAYLEACPAVRVELVTTTHHVDLAAERIDVALRAGIVRDPSLIARVLERTETIAVASPAYLERRGAPRVPNEINEHDCLRGFTGGSRPATSWPLRDGRTIAVGGPLVSNDILALWGAARAGTGIALLPREIIAADLQAGTLVQVLADTVGLDTSLSVVWLERDFLDPKIRSFIDLTVRWPAWMG